MFSGARRSKLCAMTSAVTSRTTRGQVTTRQAILTGWLLCGVLDITAACLQAWIQAGRAPAEVLRGVASALWGRDGDDGRHRHGRDRPRDALHCRADGDDGLLCRSADGCAVLRTAPLWIVGPLYGVVVFCAMNYGTLPALSWLRSLYLHTPPRWPGSMSWPQLAIHMVCVGTPIAWGVRRAP